MQMLCYEDSKIGGAGWMQDRVRCCLELYYLCAQAGVGVTGDGAVGTMQISNLASWGDVYGGC